MKFEGHEIVAAAPGYLRRLINLAGFAHPKVIFD
jgi:hypothetical protein